MYVGWVRSICVGVGLYDLGEADKRDVFAGLIFCIMDCF